MNAEELATLIKVHGIERIGGAVANAATGIREALVEGWDLIGWDVRTTAGASLFVRWESYPPPEMAARMKDLKQELGEHARRELDLRGRKIGEPYLRTERDIEVRHVNRLEQEIGRLRREIDGQYSGVAESVLVVNSNDEDTYGPIARDAGYPMLVLYRRDFVSPVPQGSMTVSEIAEQLGTTVTGVERKLRQLGIRWEIGPNPRTKGPKGVKWVGPSGLRKLGVQRPGPDVERKQLPRMTLNRGPRNQREVDPF